MDKPRKLRIRFRLRTLIVLIAVLGVLLSAALAVWSPTRRLARLVRADQPEYVRREAASALGHQIPAWEVSQAVITLLEVCDDPSPRVREYAAVGLAQLEGSAERATPKLLLMLNDEDRFVRYSAAAALGSVVGPNSGRRSSVVDALVPILDDPDPQVGLAAAETLCKLGRSRDAIGTLAAAFEGSDEQNRSRARQIMTHTGTGSSAIVEWLLPKLHNADSKRREEAYDVLMAIGGPEPIRAALQRVAESGEPELRQWARSKLKRVNLEYIERSTR
jgi:HEAT repeat protein